MANKTVDECIIDSEVIEHLTDSKFRHNFEVMRYSGEMCDVKIVVEETTFKG